MASKVVEDSSPPRPSVSYDQQTARHLLRHRRSELLHRLTYSTIKRLADTLYEVHVISHDEMEDIQSERQHRVDMARSLVSVMETRSWAHFVQFARLLQQTEGVEDVGTKLLENAGVSDGQSLDCESLVSENSQLREDKEVLRKELKSNSAKAGQHQLMETAMRTRLQMVEGVPYQDAQTATWNALPHLTHNEWWTVICAAAVGNTIVTGYYSGSDLYTLDLDNAGDESEWVISYEGLHGPILNVFSCQSSCYVAAGWDQKIYKWNMKSDTWQPIAGIPTQFSYGIVYFSLVASGERIYMVGGWLNGQAVNSAIVYDMKSDQWQSLPSMLFSGSLCSSVLIDNTLYVTGGLNKGGSGEALSACEVSALTLNESTWRRLRPMKYGYSTVTALHDRLIAIGGESLEGHEVSNVEVFDVVSDQWLPLPHMTAPRCYHGVCVTENNSLAAVGGLRSTDCEILKLM